jgi:hypothetical protein
MTFGYIGYIWAILGCSLLALFVLGAGVTLHAIGRRAERRRGARAVVDSVDLAGPTSDPRAPKDDGEAA